MSYYVIKGPKHHNNYLEIERYKNIPQWWDKEHATRWSSSDEAYKALEEIVKAHPSCTYIGRVVRVYNIRDLKRKIRELEERLL